MAYRLRFDRRFRQHLDGLPGDIKSVARRAVADLALEPRPRRAKQLDSHPGYYRLWLPRDHRLVWSVLEDEQIVDLLYVGPKTPDLYVRLGLERWSPENGG
jgi:mRNA-degrading endonuclease RelE of RelBE toxin-antitoxin system